MPEVATYEVTIEVMVRVRGTADDPADAGHRAVDAVVNRPAVGTSGIDAPRVTGLHIKRV